MTNIYLFRSMEDRIVAVTQDMRAEIDTSSFKAELLKGRAMDSAAAMSLLRHCGGILISREGRQEIPAAH